MAKIIVYIAPRIGGTSGAVKSAFDVLLALLVNNNNVVIITNTERLFVKIPKKYNGLDVNSPSRWICLKRKNISKNTYWKYLLLKALNIFKPEFFDDSSSQSIVIVNSICDYANMLGPNFSVNIVKKINIVRGSPRSFQDGFSEISVDFVSGYQNEFSKLVFVSINTKDHWYKLKESKQQPFYHIPNCADEDSVAKIINGPLIKIKNKLKISGSPIIVCLGSIQKRKGQDILLKIAPLIYEEFKNLKIILVGGVVDKYGEFIVNEINKSHLKSIFVLTGFINNPLEYLRIADLVILPSRGEALPRSLIESLALGKAIVASDVDGNSELVKNDFNGYLFQPENAHECYLNTLRILKNLELKQKFENNSILHYKSNFSQISQINRYKTLIENEFEN